METKPDTISTTDAALDALRKKIAPVACHQLSKVPAIKYGRWCDELPPAELVRLWFRQHVRANVAMICSGRLTIDIDSGDPALARWVIEKCGADTPQKMRTPRGGLHLDYALPEGSDVGNWTRVLGLPIDFRTNRGIKMIPPSVTPDGRYEWLGEGLLANSDLPVPDLSWARREERRTLQPIGPVHAEEIMVRRAWAWVACVEGAISGQHGHAKFFRVVCKLLHPPPRGFGLTVPQAMPIIDAYSDTCEPGWSQREKEHKVADALAKI